VGEILSLFIQPAVRNFGHHRYSIDNSAEINFGIYCDFRSKYDRINLKFQIPSEKEGIGQRCIKTV